MKKAFFFRVLAGVLSALLLFSVGGCAKQSQEEKARVAMIEIIDELLDYEITIAEAKEKLESMYIPTDTAEGYAMSKYKKDILSNLESGYLEGLEYKRELLDVFADRKESDYYYQKFQEQFRNNENFRAYMDFMDEFNNLFVELTGYTMSLTTVIDRDFGSVLHVHTIELDFTFRDSSIDLSIETDKDDKITWISLSLYERETWTEIEFALLASFVYRSMGFGIESFDSFAEKFDLLSEGEIYESESIGDYRISSMTTDTAIYFSVSVA